MYGETCVQSIFCLFYIILIDVQHSSDYNNVYVMPSDTEAYFSSNVSIKISFECNRSLPLKDSTVFSLVSGSKI